MGAVIRFEVPGHIVPWARSGGHGKVRFTPKPQRDFMATLKQIGSDAMDGSPPLAGPVALDLVAVWPWPKSLSAKKRALPGADLKTSRPDADNVAKIVKDALNLVVFVDDAQITDTYISKRFGDRPGLTIEVRTLP